MFSRNQQLLRQSLREWCRCIMNLTFIFIGGSMTNDDASLFYNNLQFPVHFHIDHLIWFSRQPCEVWRAGIIVLIFQMRKRTQGSENSRLTSQSSKQRSHNCNVYFPSDIDFNVLATDNFPKLFLKNHGLESYAVKTKLFLSIYMYIYIYMHM